MLCQLNLESQSLELLFRSLSLKVSNSITLSLSLFLSCLLFHFHSLWFNCTDCSDLVVYLNSFPCPASPNSRSSPPHSPQFQVDFEFSNFELLCDDFFFPPLTDPLTVSVKSSPLPSCVVINCHQLELSLLPVVHLT